MKIEACGRGISSQKGEGFADSPPRKIFLDFRLKMVHFGACLPTFKVQNDWCCD